MKNLTKFEKVNLALMEKTRDSVFLRVTKDIDSRHHEKYALQNVVTGNTYGISYKSLDEIIEVFELNIDLKLEYSFNLTYLFMKERFILYNYNKDKKILILKYYI